jgi:hypothetical protein
MVAVAVCIYDRFENLKRWIHAWKNSDTAGAELYIIHNQDIIQDNPFKQLCRANDIQYIARPNVGYGTGVIQDLYLNRLGLPAWSHLLFCTDDTIPIDKNFIQGYLGGFKPDIGAVCMEISGTWTPHIRTTGFMVTREAASRIKWVHDPVTTKEHDYFYEHQGYQDTIMAQLLVNGYRVIQLTPIQESLLWDSHHNWSHQKFIQWCNVYS